MGRIQPDVGNTLGSRKSVHCSLAERVVARNHALSDGILLWLVVRQDWGLMRLRSVA